MLTLTEKFLFTLAVIISLYFTWRGVDRIIKLISNGQGRPDWKAAVQRNPEVME